MKKTALLAAFLAACLAAAPPAAAGTLAASLDFLWKPDPGNDTQVFLHVANTAFQPPRDQVRTVYPLLRTPETDFPILAFLASEAHVSLSAVWDLRSKGVPWAQVMVKLNVPPERIFVPLQRREPGPPYGKAYGHWKKHPKEGVAVTDDDVFYWVNVQSQAKYFGVPAETVVGWRESGPTWKSVAGSQYRGKHDREEKEKGKGGGDQGDQHSGHSKGKGKGKGR